MALHQFVDEYKDGKCEWCGNDGAVFVDNNRCEQCDSDIVRCSICKEDQHVDDHCRHVFRDGDWSWSGSGIGEPDDGIKQSFFRLLDLMPVGFADDLGKAIRSGRFHTWLVAPMIGGGGYLSLYGMPATTQWGDSLIRIGEGDFAEETADGYHWLVSLYDRKSGKANRITVAWINERITPSSDRDADSPSPDPATSRGGRSG